MSILRIACPWNTVRAGGVPLDEVMEVMKVMKVMGSERKAAGNRLRATVRERHVSLNLVTSSTGDARQSDRRAPLDLTVACRL
jgi:hypothetical protein